MAHGCGRFPDEAWAELLAAGDGAGRGLLGAHLDQCPDCRAEFESLAAFGREVRQALAGSAQAKHAFVQAVMSDVAALRSRPQPGESRKPWWRPGTLGARAAAFAAACAVALLAVSISGVLHWWDGDGRSAAFGYTAPGGTILSSADLSAPPSAGALTTQGAAAASVASAPARASDAAPAAGPGRAGAGSARPIYSPLGIAVAAAEGNEG